MEFSVSNFSLDESTLLTKELISLPLESTFSNTDVGVDDDDADGSRIPILASCCRLGTVSILHLATFDGTELKKLVILCFCIVGTCANTIKLIYHITVFTTSH